MALSGYDVGFLYQLLIVSNKTQNLLLAYYYDRIELLLRCLIRLTSRRIHNMVCVGSCDSSGKRDLHSLSINAVIFYKVRDLLVNPIGLVLYFIHDGALASYTPYLADSG
ncbi:hypothetical protein VNO77_34379 [Canavalia gladiata]|uniref:Uncharacterized protein n=1 Tax=Canavalia gladiata TaxID=3824 RepID=A0AAN9PYH3_CANGL